MKLSLITANSLISVHPKIRCCGHLWYCLWNAQRTCLDGSNWTTVHLHPSMSVNSPGGQGKWSSNPWNPWKWRIWRWWRHSRIWHVDYSSFNFLLDNILGQNFVMIQIHDLRGWTWSWDLLKTFIYSNFDPMGASRNKKIKIRLRKISYFVSQNIVPEEIKGTYGHNVLKLYLREYLLFLCTWFFMLMLLAVEVLWIFCENADAWKYECFIINYFHPKCTYIRGPQMFPWNLTDKKLKSCWKFKFVGFHDSLCSGNLFSVPFYIGIHFSSK